MLAPGVHDSLDRLGAQVGAVREHDDRRLRPLGQRLEPAAERCARPALPGLAARDAGRPGGVRVERIGALDHDDLVDRARRQSREHLGQSSRCFGVPNRDASRRRGRRRRSGFRDGDVLDQHRLGRPLLLIAEHSDQIDDVEAVGDAADDGVLRRARRRVR